MNGFEKRTEEKKRKILEAAFELINGDTDAGNVTMEEIAKHANVGKATLFKYFGSKDNLIREVFQDFINQLITDAKEIIAENHSFEETLIALSQNKISYLDKINHQFYMRMMDFFTKKDEEGLSLMMQKFNEVNYGMLLDLFHRGRKEGKVDLKYSDEFLILYFQAIVEGISKPQIYEKIAPYTEEWTEMLIKGIAPRKD
ncbi:TetR family transcriptional regulator [Oceanobacillus oncorhynchi subsp. incaldanensis]|uniref:HTH-type transcriptional regulator BetI n=2 Tax=Oceanobacillus TaxID=182709 RepID=A0A0A1MT67_9BACI|nr:TetR/AcrR family transcriptional regulator [Oceanobacillus oncorhynchi]GIO20499.1 TetR family transcriptional regulator [Oceanobacillus oncorhynchi subsp. incaldanensis]CEI82752.1 HTH-type transcriptional regulator BetI [Oceanobacillus oncorhynchi]